MEDKEKLKQKLIEAIITSDQLTYEGKFRLAEKNMVILNDVLDGIKRGHVDINLLLDLSHHENMKVRHIAALNMLRFNYMTDRALEALTSVANSNVPIIALVASWQIKSWNEYGTVDPPRKVGVQENKKPTVAKKKDATPTFEPAIAKYEDLTEKQRVAYLSYWYDAEVNNGGHLQYFESRGTIHIEETTKALIIIGAKKQAKVLTKAGKFYLSIKKKNPRTIDEYINEAKRDVFGKYDSAFCKTNTQVMDLVDEYLIKNDL